MDKVRYRNGFEPNNLPWYCDGCGAVLTTEHGLNRKHGWLVHKRHNATADTWICLEAQAFQPSVCSHKPMMNEGNPRGRGNRGAGAPSVAPATQLATQPTNPPLQILGLLKTRRPQL